MKLMTLGLVKKVKMMSMKQNVAFNCGKYGQMSEIDIGVGLDCMYNI